MAPDGNKNPQQHEKNEMVNEKNSITTCKYLHFFLLSYLHLCEVIIITLYCWLCTTYRYNVYPTITKSEKRD